MIGFKQKCAVMKAAVAAKYKKDKDKIPDGTLNTDMIDNKYNGFANDKTIKKEEEKLAAEKKKRELAEAKKKQKEAAKERKKDHEETRKKLEKEAKRSRQGK